MAGYYFIALPLAAGVLAPLGLVLPAWVGAVLVSLSTMIVALNAQTLRRLRLCEKLGDDAAQPRYIQTGWSVGYRFVGPHEEA